jgi:hypothetical protein
LSATDWDLRIHYEIKSNLEQDDVRGLKAAAVTHVQPGIESLSSRVLTLMRKGVTGARNVQLLRACEELSVTVAWNYLYGFPGEEPDDYWTILEQIGALVHLQPPSGANRILLERFSPYFEDPTMGFTSRTPASFYALVYDLPVDQLADMAFVFDADPAGITGAVEKTLSEAITRWQDHYPRSALTSRDLDSRIVIRDERTGGGGREYVLADPREAAAYRALTRDLTVGGIKDAVDKAGCSVSAEYLTGWLGEMRRAGLVFEEAERFVALAVKEDPRRVRLQA